MIAPFYVKPGVYFKITDVPAPLVSSGEFLPLFVGLGRKELDVMKDIIRGDTEDGTDVISENDEVVILVHSLIDADGIVYKEGIDFKLIRPEDNVWKIDWGNPQSITGTEDLTGPVVLTNLTLKLNINGLNYTITFTETETDIATICTKINTVVGSTVASDNGSGYLKLEANLVSIEGGSSLSILGFIQGQKVESKEPAAGKVYTLAYKRIKKASEYKQLYFTRLEDVYADQGAKGLPKVLITQGIPTGVSGGNTEGLLLADFEDTNAKFVTNKITFGNYIKITDGSGKGQIRVIVEVSSETALKVAPIWNEVPDSTSKYVITDTSYNQISNAVYFANLNGAQAFVVSQVPDDIIDDNNWRGAINKTKDLVDGTQGWCLVPLRGFDENEPLLSYIKNYLFEVNSTVSDKERIALVGVKSNLNFNSVISLLNSTSDERIGITVNLYAKDDNDNIWGSEYIAAAICGINCNPNFDCGEPISGKAIQGFKLIYNNYNDYESRLIGQNGGILVEKQGVDYKIVHFLSTNTTDIIKSELKVVKQKDVLKKSIRSILRAALINTRALDIAISRADSIIRMILDIKVENTEIYSYRNLSIAFDGNEPRQLNINFEFKPTFDINWCFVQFGAHI
jgi:hypothetical protein